MRIENVLYLIGLLSFAAQPIASAQSVKGSPAQAAQSTVKQTAANLAAPPAATSSTVTTTGGTANYLSKFTGASTVANSIVYDNGTDVGIGIVPNGNAKLDVNGPMIMRGNMTVSRTGNATTSKGYPSFGFDFYSNAYNSSSKAAINPFFQLQSEPSGNNTASPGATLNFLYSSVGGTPTETGLYFNPNGTIHFSSAAQTFPIAAGPQGPAGPAGPKGAVGATGPAGGLNLPYSAYGPNNNSALFNLYNSGTNGIGIAGAGGSTDGNGTDGTGVIGYGGPSMDASDAAAGVGVRAVGGASAGDNNIGTRGGDGVVGIGGSAPGTSDLGGNGGTFVGTFGAYGILAGGGDARAAGLFYGDVDVEGNLSKSGGSFKIDHPSDPANKYLYHSFVESPDMKNIYDGTVVTDGRGEAIVSMPDYFESLNRDFRYQLTIMGEQFAQARISSKINGNIFIIKTDKPNVEVSWQVTGVRQDAWANAHRIPNEVDKAEKEKGHYLHPELFGHPEDASISERAHPLLKRPRAAGIANH